MNQSFFIIAGPNGAGKSTNGSEFVPESLAIFNGDLVFAELKRRYPNLKPEQLERGYCTCTGRCQK